MYTDANAVASQWPMLRATVVRHRFLCF